MSEQEATDWFFPTSYISVSHRATELIQKSVYQLDKEEQIKAYIEEAKPLNYGTTKNTMPLWNIVVCMLL